MDSRFKIQESTFVAKFPSNVESRAKFSSLKLVFQNFCELRTAVDGQNTCSSLEPPYPQISMLQSVAYFVHLRSWMVALSIGVTSNKINSAIYIHKGQEIVIAAWREVCMHFSVVWMLRARRPAFACTSYSIWPASEVFLGGPSNFCIFPKPNSKLADFFVFIRLPTQGFPIAKSWPNPSQIQNITHLPA